MGKADKYNRKKTKCGLTRETDIQTDRYPLDYVLEEEPNATQHEDEATPVDKSFISVKPRGPREEGVPGLMDPVSNCYSVIRFRELEYSSGTVK